MIHSKRHVDFQTMTFEQLIAHFSEQSSDLKELLTVADAREELDVVLNVHLGNMWEDGIRNTHLAKDIRSYLYARGFQKEDINLTNTQKGWQRRKEAGLESDYVEKVRAWLSGVSAKVSRLFRRQ